MIYGPPLQYTKPQTRQAVLKPSLRIYKIRKLTQMPTLRTAATATSTRIDQAPPVTPAATPVQKYTPADEPARSASCAVRKDVGL